MKNEQNPRDGLAGGVKVEYPAHWPDGTMEVLEASPRWKKYYLGNKGTTHEPIAAGMLFDWNAQYGRFISLLRLIAYFEGKSPFISDENWENEDIHEAFEAIHYGMESLKQDLYDIIEFIHHTDGLPRESPAEPKQPTRIAAVDR